MHMYDIPGSLHLRWELHGDGRSVAADDIVKPWERLSWPRTAGLGMQHVVAMFGATFLAPVLTGFPPNTTLFFSGLGTLLFLMITANRVPSYLGSSFAFIAPIAVARAMGPPGQGYPLFGVMCVGIGLAGVGAVTIRAGRGWIDALMPPVVSGAIVALIGLNLASVAKADFTDEPLLGLVTLVTVLVVTVAGSGLLSRMAIFVGAMVGCALAWATGDLDLSAVGEAAWLGLPTFAHPTNPFTDPAVLGVLPAFLPVILVLVAENVGHIRGVAQMADPQVNSFLGRGLLADGVATALAGAGGGSGTTTYGENIGVMAASRVYSTAAYWIAGVFAMLLGFSPKVGAAVNAIPLGVLGGVTTALYGLIAVIGVKIWLDNKVDFSQPINQFTAGTAMIIGVADYTFSFGDLTFNGIALGSIAALVIYHGLWALGRRTRRAEPAGDR